jgi:hypothetical protein
VNQIQPRNISHKGFQNSNTTNVEVYGVHFVNAPVYTRLSGVSSKGKFREQISGTFASPGEKLIFTATVLDGHLPGLHWYHSNILGSSALQVMGGLFGAIIIEPGAIYESALGPLKALKHSLMSFSHVMLENNDMDQVHLLQTIGYKDDIALLSEGDPFSTAFSLTRLSLAGRSTLPIDPVYYPMQTDYNISLKNNITKINGTNQVIIKDAWFTNGQ